MLTTLVLISSSLISERMGEAVPISTSLILPYRC
jgi:hypothetical protein